MEEQIKAILADVLDLEPDAVDESIAMDNAEGWDSMSHINLCLAIEEQFGVTFEVEEMQAMLSYYDILDVLEAKLQSRAA